MSKDTRHPLDKLNQGELKPIAPSCPTLRVKPKQCIDCGRIFAQWKKCHGVNVCPHCGSADK